MATINKEVKGGAITLVGTTDTYNLVIPTLINTGLPHYLDNQVIEECYFICDTSSENCIINLPPISAFKGSWGPKFYFSNMGEGSVIINVGSPGDTINGFTSWEISTEFETDYFHVVDYDLWANFKSLTIG
jgi:hypothetical protein